MSLQSRSSLVLLLLFAGTVVLWGLGSGRGLAQFGQQTWQSDSGLPQNTVHSVLQTTDGYLWVATEAGLVRFDGISFRIYDTENTPELRSDLVNDLKEDSTGALWISTTGGLVRESGGRFRLFTVADGLPSSSVLSTFAPKAGGLLAITSAGIAVLHNERFRKVAETVDLQPLDGSSSVAEDGRGQIFVAGSRDVVSLRADGSDARVLPVGTEMGEIHTLAISGSNELWVGARNGVAILNQGASAALPGLERLPSRDVHALLPDGAGGMWIGTTRGLAHWTGGAISASRGLDPFAGASVERLFRDREGAVWVATSRGLGRIVSGSSDLLPQRSRLTGVLSIFEDREGSVWLGTENAGLTVLREQAFSTVTEQSGLTARSVRAVYGDGQGTIWIGTDGGGLDRIVEGRVERLATHPDLSSDVVLSVARTGADLWVGTPNGLDRVRSGVVRVFSTEDGLPDDFVRSLYADRDGSLWIGTRNGLSHLVNGAFRSYSRMDGLGADLIGAMLRTRAGELWVGTLGGLSRWTGDGFATLSKKDGLGSDAVTSLLEDSAGTLWIGTQDAGLSRLQHGRLVALPAVRAGVPETVFGMLEDGSGDLWLSSRRGIYRVRTTDLNRVADGGKGAVLPRIYGVADGMRISEASSGGHPAAWRMANGSLWFATLDGVAWVNPASLARNEVAPPTAIEGVLLNDRPVDVGALMRGAELRVPPEERRLQVQYAGLSFVAPQKVRYRYRLTGFDKAWVYAGSRREAFYTNLSPGRYRFEVMSQNNDGVWSAHPSGFAVRVEPTLLESWWFYGLLALALGALAFAAYRWRVHTVEAQYEAVLGERGRIAREIHDTLAQGYVAISVQLEVASRLLDTSKEAALRQLEQTKELVRASLAEARSSIWNLRSLSETGTLPSQMAAMTESRSSQGGPAVKLEIKGTYRPVAAVVEQEVLRIAQEAVTNAVRHADARQIVVVLRYDAGFVELRVSDDGRGFAGSATDLSRNGHFGVQGMRERAARIGARLHVASEPGKGTVVALDVDARKVEREERL